MVELNIKDPLEPSNEERATRAHRAIDAFFEGDIKSDNLGTNVTDLLANLMHLCSLEGVDFGEALAQAKEFFDEEFEEELGDGWLFIAADTALSH
ncbi:MAG TPA: hypothetical protein VF656_19040 [Pyrinomonadaceae bacterium]|jgi:hypothetical protein